MLNEADLLDDDRLIERLLELARAGKFLFVEDGWFKYIDEPVSEFEIARAEKMLGLSFPPFLKRIYLEVGYHFGPGSGLLRLFTPEGKRAEKESIVSSTLLQHEFDDDDGEEPFPHALMVISICGSNCYYCVDCSQPEYPIILIDSDQYTNEEEAPSMQQWLINWLKRENLLDDGAD